jgi:hypothetical protein
VDLVRPKWDWDQLEKKVRELQPKLLKQLAASIPARSIDPPTDEVPDYLGQAVHLVGEECFRALAANDDELFSQLFPIYFLGITAVVERMRAEVGNWQPLPAVTAISEPMVDLMAISGCALIFSELHNNAKLKDVTEKAWRDIYSGPDQHERLKFVAAMHDHQRHLFALSHRTSRTRWQMAMQEPLAELPRDRPDHEFGQGAVQHDSALIRRIAPLDGDIGFIAYEASDVFVVRFLSTLEGAEDLDFGVAEHIADALKIEADGEQDEE